MTADLPQCGRPGEDRGRQRLCVQVNRARNLAAERPYGQGAIQLVDKAAAVHVALEIRADFAHLRGDERQVVDARLGRRP